MKFQVPPGDSASRVDQSRRDFELVVAKPREQSTPSSFGPNGRAEASKLIPPGELTVLLPVHNEADTIERVIAAFYDQVVSPSSARLLVCEDGSTDETGSVLDRLAAVYPMRLERGGVRKGYAGAVRDGLRSTKTEFVFFADSDGQYYPEDFWKLVSSVGDSDMVIGRKVDRNEPAHRIVLSRGFHVLVRILTGVGLDDIDCGFRILRKSVVDGILDSVADLPYSFWAEFTILASLHGYRIRQVPVSHRERLAGGSTIYQPKALPKIILSQVRGLLRLRKRIRK